MCGLPTPTGGVGVASEHPSHAAAQQASTTRRRLASPPGRGRADPKTTVDTQVVPAGRVAPDTVGSVVDWVRLRLDVEAFDDAAFEPYLRRARDRGIDFATMAELGDTAEHRRALYELNRTCAADIPERGEFYSFDEYVAQRIEVPSFEPAGVVLAVTEGEWIGMSATSLHPAKQTAFSEMTGVLAPYRGQGLSLALKLLAIRFARSSGYRWLTTFHHPRNASAIAMNRRLGFADLHVDQ